MRENDVSFDGQRVIIAGGSTGIGEAAARAFAAAGAQVTITGRAKPRLDAAAQRIGYPVGVAEFDATDGAAVAAFFETAGPFDHLVLAASPGVVGSGPFIGLDEAALRQAFDGKFFAHVKVLQAARPRLRADGSVTIVSAVSARAAYPGAAGLSAVNGALEAIVPTLAVELVGWPAAGAAGRFLPGRGGRQPRRPGGPARRRGRRHRVPGQRGLRHRHGPGVHGRREPDRRRRGGLRTHPGPDRPGQPAPGRDIMTPCTGASPSLHPAPSGARVRARRVRSIRASPAQR
jgi:Enoyl-(Acyl carrier protein) reductase